MAEVGKPTRTVVTGVAGFIGSHLADALLATGHSVLGIDVRDPEVDATAAANLAGCVGHKNFCFLQGDIRYLPLPELVAGSETVFHLAGIPGVRSSWGRRFSLYASCNIVGTQRVVDACVRTGTPRLVIASSSSIYGQRNLPFREDEHANPASPYGVSKLASEQVMFSYGIGSEVSTTLVALRYFSVYGPRQRPDMLIDRLLRASLSRLKIQVYGDGSQRRDFTYVGDVVSATLAAGKLNVSAAINVGSGSNSSVAEVMSIVARLTGEPAPVTNVGLRDGDVSQTLADITKARSLLNWTPTIDLATGVARQCEWLKSSWKYSSELPG